MPAPGLKYDERAAADSSARMCGPVAKPPTRRRRRRRGGDWCYFSNFPRASAELGFDVAAGPKRVRIAHFGRTGRMRG